MKSHQHDNDEHWHGNRGEELIEHERYCARYGRVGQNTRVQIDAVQSYSQTVSQGVGNYPQKTRGKAHRFPESPVTR